MARTGVLFAVLLCLFAACGHGQDSAVAKYVAKVGPPTRSLYASWNRYTASIGSSSGSDEDAVKRSHDTAASLQQLLNATTPPEPARVFHAEISDVVKNILTVVEDRLQLALSTPDPNARKLLQDQGGNAFYFVKQTFPDAISQLRSLEKIAKG